MASVLLCSITAAVLPGALFTCQETTRSRWQRRMRRTRGGEGTSSTMRRAHAHTCTVLYSTSSYCAVLSSRSRTDSNGAVPSPWQMVIPTPLWHAAEESPSRPMSCSRADLSLYMFRSTRTSAADVYRFRTTPQEAVHPTADMEATTASPSAYRYPSIGSVLVQSPAASQFCPPGLAANSSQPTSAS
jgi:hypothetical protein